MRPPTIWIGIDPGVTWTGIVVRSGSTLLHHDVVDAGQVPNYRAALAGGIAAAWLTCAETGGDPGIAIEDWNRPTPQLGQVRPAELMALADTVGYCHGWCEGKFGTDLVMRVPPTGHGRRPLSTYPRPLVTDGEWRVAVRDRSFHQPARANTDLRHARSAWDVAGAGAMQWRLNTAIAIARAGIER
jgi:hypothetical protein